MKRVADGWQEISWQQAFDEVEQGIRAVQAKHGRHSVAFYAGNPTVHNMGAMMFVAPLMAGLHSKNKFSATVLTNCRICWRVCKCLGINY